LKLSAGAKAADTDCFTILTMMRVASACYCFMPNATGRISHRERFGSYWKNWAGMSDIHYKFQPWQVLARPRPAHKDPVEWMSSTWIVCKKGLQVLCQPEILS